MSPSDQERIEQQIVELQTQLAYQDDVVQALNNIVGQQQLDILSLQGQMRSLLEELKVLLSELDQGGPNRLSENERPPHY